MRAEIICIGNELLEGYILNTHTQYLSNELLNLGIDTIRQLTIQDDVSVIHETIESTSSRSDILIITGGLGPTIDDVTRNAVAKAVNKPLVLNIAELEKIADFFDKRNQPMPESNKIQAYFPEGAQIFVNPIGTAAAFAVNFRNKIIICLPGPPRELRAVFEGIIKDFIKNKFKLSRRIIKTLIFVGISESALQDKLLKIQKLLNKDISLAFLPSQGMIQLRITSREKDVEQINEILRIVKEQVHQYIFCEDESLEEHIINLLKATNQTIAFAESCTGGILSQRITNVSGSSNVFTGGVVAYSNHVKDVVLGVPKETLDNYGAVSEETALAMAFGVKNLLETDIGVSVTGIAGPTGGSNSKPVGLVYIALINDTLKICKKYVFSGNRDMVRERSTIMALDLIRRNIKV